MIGVHYAEDQALQNWYGRQILPVVFGGNVPPNTQPALDEIHREISGMSQKTVEDILFLPRMELEQRYDWIREYGKLCDLAACAESFAGQVRERCDRKTYTHERKRYLQRFSGVYQDQLLARLHLSEDDCSGSWRNFNLLRREAEMLLQNMNALIGARFSYDHMPSNVRYQLWKKMDVTVCPYCNRQYIQSYRDGQEDRYLGDLDHLYPKAYYCLYSLSLWNLLPSCKACNQKFKGRGNHSILFPTERGFEDDCVLHLDCHSVAAMIGADENFDISWKIDTSISPELAEKIQNNLSLFKLNEVYQYHKTDVKDLLRKKYLYSGAYGRKLEEMLTGLPGMTEDEKNRLRYGTSLNRENFRKEPLGKMTYDVVVSLYGNQ